LQALASSTVKDIELAFEDLLHAIEEAFPGGKGPDFVDLGRKGGK
jgi:hypothetical protein